MQTAKHLLFVTNSPQQQVNALILARKLALVATQHGYKHSVISLDEFESSDHFDHVIIIGQQPKNLNIFGQNALSLVSIEDIKDDADKALLTALEHSKLANEWEQKPKQVSNTLTHFVAITACPTGVAHTFMAAGSITTRCRKTWVSNRCRNSRFCRCEEYFITSSDC